MIICVGSAVMLISQERKGDSMINKKKKSRSASILGCSASSQNLLSIELPRPTFDRGKSVLKALQKRKTIREIRDKKLSLQVLSNLLWAACGVNRKKAHLEFPGELLRQQVTHRKLIFMLPCRKEFYYMMRFITGNVYLYAASIGLASWFHNCDKSGLTAILKLRIDQRVLFGQTVGYPVKD
jgi:hypothetical protein